MKQLIFTLTIFCLALTANANNVTTSNIFISGQNATSHFSLINYDISWENSWRTSTNENNYDGVWIFVKFRKVNTSNWQHATINYTAPGTAAASGHTQATGSTIQTAADGKGIWMYRSANGQGNVNFLNNNIRWNYGVDGVQDNDSVEVRLFAVEMVKVNQGAYNLGSGGSEVAHFRDGAVDTYFPINSENSITSGAGAGQLTASTSIFAGTIPAAYPKGFKAFWIMKYEFSAQQYTDFLNTIDAAKAVNREISVTVTGTHPNYVANNPTQAQNSMGILDVLAWLDWAAMRPFTELEYEKASRGGGQIPIANEYPWGTTSIVKIATPSNQYLSNETWSIGNCSYNTVLLNVMRCGALATATSTRSSSGATYYGAMEMGGNMIEPCVGISTAAGVAYTGLHGDGNLSPTGEHNTAFWPTNAGDGSAYRGGNWGDFAAQIRVSDRFFGYNYFSTPRSGSIGGRGARTFE